MFSISQQYLEEEVVVEGFELLECDVAVLLSEGMHNSEDLGGIVDQVVGDHVRRQEGFAIGGG